MHTERELRTLLADVLNLGGRADTFTSATPLLGALPELDSMAVVVLIAGIEDHFAIALEDEDLTEETFATLGSLAAIIEARRAG